MIHSIRPLCHSFYQRDTVEVARDLLGKTLVRVTENQIYTGLITETEAYRSDDEACHAYKGLTRRSAPLFGDVGHTYVYLCYGIHYCLNIVARDKTCVAGGVLLRGLWISDAQEGSPVIGPGNLTKKLNITTEHTGINVTQWTSALFVATGKTIPEHCIENTPRIGLSKAQDKCWRFLYTP